MEDTAFIDLIHTTGIFNDKVIVQYMNKFNRNVGISQIVVLSQLYENGPQMPSHLAKKLGYTTGAMTGIADKLVKAGYTKREAKESDRRVSLLKITDEGIEIFKDAQTHSNKLKADLYSALSDEEIKQYLNIQKKLLKHLMEDK